MRMRTSPLCAFYGVGQGYPSHGSAVGCGKGGKSALVQGNAKSFQLSAYFLVDGKDQSMARGGNEDSDPWLAFSSAGAESIASPPFVQNAKDGPPAE